MRLVDDLKTYARFAWGLQGYLRQSLTLDQAKEILQRRLADRETAFLRVVERAVYGYPRSPYLPLLKQAGCTLGDLQALLKAQGLEATLRALREAGVYITFEEFKGRAPIIKRGGLEYPVQASDFDNPFLSHSFYLQSGGSTGVGTRVPLDLDFIADRSPGVMWLYAAHGVFGAPALSWRGILPDPTGVMGHLIETRAQALSRRWFTPLTEREAGSEFKHRLATWYIVAMGRLLGKPFPWPEPLPLDQAVVLARLAVDYVKTHGRCLIRTGVSRATRIALAARDAGLDLSGVKIIGGGEPPTLAKMKAIAEVGARFIPTYAFTEAGQIAVGCVTPVDENDLHLQSDSLALIQSSRPVPGFDLSVDAIYYTTLLTSAPKIMLNIESDDYGVIERRSCGCVLGELGFHDHIREVRSFRKLTGEGVTLVGSEMVHVLENVLPARFGGTPLDYQFQEEEDGQGFTRLILAISPRVVIADEAEVVQVVLEALGKSSASANLARAMWSQAGTLQVKRAEPIWTARAKLNPLHLVQRLGSKTESS